MKLALKILLIVLFLIAIFGLYIYSIVSKLKFDFEIKNINLQDFILKEISGKGSKVKIDIEFKINNKSNTTIKIKDLYVEAFYKGKLIGNSIYSYENLKEISITKKTDNILINQEFYALVNSESIDLATKIAAKIPVDIGYVIKLKLFGLDIKYSSVYNYK